MTDAELIARALIDYTDPDTIARQNIAPNAGCDIDGTFYDVRNLVHLASSQADRIEALSISNATLIAERDEAWKRAAHAERMWGEAEAKLAENEVRLRKAVELALEECPFREGTGSYNDWWHDRRATLAEIKSGVATTPYGLEGESQ